MWGRLLINRLVEDEQFDAGVAADDPRELVAVLGLLAEQYGVTGATIREASGC